MVAQEAFGKLFGTNRRFNVLMAATIGVRSGAFCMNAGRIACFL
jgi:hypothetical protein